LHHEIQSSANYCCCSLRSYSSGPACNRSLYGADDKSKIHVGIVFDIGGKDDRSFNAAAWTGVKCAQQTRASPAQLKPGCRRSEVRHNYAELRFATGFLAVGHHAGFSAFHAGPGPPR